MRVFLASAGAVVALVVPAVAFAAPTVSAFYYPWYGTAARDGAWLHWSQNGHSPPTDIASNYWPARGVYSSGEPAVVRSQMDEIRAAGIDQIVVSWWGRGSVEDERLPAVLTAARRDGIAVAAHIEPYPGRSVATVLADIDYLRTLGISSFYVYRPLDFPPAEWAAANATLKGVQVYAQTALVGAALAGDFAGVYTYDVLVYGGDKFSRICAEAHAVHLLCLPSVGPGYDAQRATGDPRVKPRRNGATYDSMWRAAIAANADQVTVTSFNEWHEGTQIEPAARRAGYLSYDGAWGLRGAAARTAYLTRTAYWSALFRSSLAARGTVSAH
jgi:glycoprotein endo-alpha-1,2-mannosidase